MSCTRRFYERWHFHTVWSASHFRCTTWNLISDHQILTIQMSKAEKHNHVLNQLIWFQFLVGATSAQVEDNLIEYRRSQIKCQCIFLAVQHNSMHDLRMMEDKITPPHSIREAQLPSRRHESPNDVRPHHDDSFRGPVAQATGLTNVDTACNQIKKRYAVHSYFKDRQFTGAHEQSIDILLRDYEICAEQQCLRPGPNVPALSSMHLQIPLTSSFLHHCSTSIPFDHIASQMRRHYNSETRKTLEPVGDGRSWAHCRSCISTAWRIGMMD